MSVTIDTSAVTAYFTASELIELGDFAKTLTHDTPGPQDELVMTPDTFGWRIEVGGAARGDHGEPGAVRYLFRGRLVTEEERRDLIAAEQQRRSEVAARQRARLAARRAARQGGGDAA